MNGRHSPNPNQHFVPGFKCPDCSVARGGTSEDGCVASAQCVVTWAVTLCRPLTSRVEGPRSSRRKTQRRPVTRLESLTRNAFGSPHMPVTRMRSSGIRRFLATNAHWYTWAVNDTGTAVKHVCMYAAWRSEETLFQQTHLPVWYL